MTPIVSTLIAVSLLGLLFPNTRWMGIAAVALLTFRYPLPSLAALALGLAIFIFNRFR